MASKCDKDQTTLWFEKRSKLFLMEVVGSFIVKTRLIFNRF